MEWNDYKFPEWVTYEIRRQILEQNQSFEDWAAEPRKFKLYAVCDLVRLFTVEDDIAVCGSFIYYKDDVGFILDKLNVWHKVKLSQTVAIRPQMIEYQAAFKKNKESYYRVLNTLIKCEGQLLNSLVFPTIAYSLIKIPIGLKAEYEQESKAVLSDTLKVGIS